MVGNVVYQHVYLIIYIKFGFVCDALFPVFPFYFFLDWLDDDWRKHLIEIIQIKIHFATLYDDLD